MAFKIVEIVRKGDAAKLLNEEHFAALKEHGVPDWYIDSCMKIKYMFPKAHAAAYCIAALRVAWYKVYHKAEYYAAYFTVRSDDFDAEPVIKGRAEVKRRIDEIRMKGKDTSATEQAQAETLHIVYEAMARGVEFLPVDLYKSHSYKFLMEDRSACPSTRSGDWAPPPLGLMEAAKAEVLYHATICRREAGFQNRFGILKTARLTR